MDYSPVVEELVDEETDLDVEGGKDLIVHNDDFNTFDHVINTLIKVCDHDPQQAEQCTYIIHYRGKCAVKKGTLQTLKPMKDGITDAGISATIE